MLIRMGGKLRDEDESASGQTGTGDHSSASPSGVRISRPGWPERWKRRVMLP